MIIEILWKIRLIALVSLSILSVNAYSAAWLYEGFDWSLPSYATESPNGGMLDIHGINHNQYDPEVKGDLVRLLWSEMETEQGVYTYNRLDDILNNSNTKKVLVRLEVNSRCHAPEWAVNAIPYSYNQSFQFWKPAYINNLSGLINDFASKYSFRAQIAGVHLGIADGEYYNGEASSCPPVGTSYAGLVDGFGRDGWGEFWWTYQSGNNVASRANEEQIYKNDGLTPENFDSSVRALIDLYANAFGSYAGKLAWMNYSDFGSDPYKAKLVGIHNYAMSKGLGGREGEVESWMRYTDNVYGVNLISNQGNDLDDVSCSMTFNEAFADTIQGRYWGEENEFYGDGDSDPDLGYITDRHGAAGNQPYRFYVSSMRALQLRRNYVSIHDKGHIYLRGLNDKFEWEYTGNGTYDPSLRIKYHSGDFITYLTKTLGRSRSDTPDAFVVLGQRPLNAGVGTLYPPEYASRGDSCLVKAQNTGYALVSDFGRWLSPVSRTLPDYNSKKSMQEKQWGQIMSVPRINENGASEHYELYARKSNAMYFDLNDQLIRERCGSTCNIQVKVVFKDDHQMTLQAVPTNGSVSTLPGQTYGDNVVRTATFELSDFSGGGTQPDFHIKTTDDSDLSVLLVRVNFMSNQVGMPSIPTGDAPKGSTLAGDVIFSWKPVSGATEYNLSYHTTAGGYVGGSYKTAATLNCTSGTCSETVSNLPLGSGQWWVRAKNATGESGWSQTVDFTISNSLVAPTIISPVNNITTEGTVTVTWESTGTPQYHVSYNNSGQYNPGSVSLNSVDLNCSTGTCSHTIYDLTSGQSEWWVLAKNASTESAWSNGGTFTVTPPAKPTIKEPINGVNTDSSVVLRWWPTAGATEYKVDYENDGLYQADIFRPANDFNCSTEVCSHTLYNLKAGASKWWVTAQSSAGTLGSTGANLFTVVPPITPTVISPQDNVSTAGGVTLKWWPTAGALRYRVDYENNGVYIPGTTSDATTFNCGSGECSYTLYDLASGASKWWVTADSEAGSSSSTGANEFTVIPPATPTVKSPQNNESTGSTVTFTWWPTAGALRYKVDYQNNGNYVEGPTLDAATYNCQLGECNYTVSGLAPTASTWWVTADSSAGPSQSTGANDFVVAP